MKRTIGTLLLVAFALTQVSDAAVTLPTYGTGQILFNPNRPPVVSATADFNCDGRTDAIVANGDGSSSTYPVNILLADGLGSFVDGTSQVVVGSPHQTQYPSGLVLADFNDDGHTDVFIPDQAAQNLGSSGYQNTLLLSTSDCHLVDGTAGIPQQADFTWGSAAADVDGDGDVDLLVVNDWGPSPPVPMQLWLNDGSGHFSVASGALPTALTDPNQIGVIGYKAAAFADVNGDGFVDLVLGADYRTANSLVLLNDGTGHFTQLPSAMPAKPFGTTDIVFDLKSADFNHDGHPDLVLAFRTRATGSPGRWLQILINNGNGTFRDETPLRLPQADNTSVWFVTVRLVDIDGDGNLDLAARPAFNFDHFYATADATGVFTPVTLTPGASVDAADTLVDVNANGHRDIVSVFTNRVTLLPNNNAVLPPGVPQEVRARSLPDRVRVTWPYVWGATSYQVWRAASPEATGAQLGTTTLTTFDDLTAGAAPAYYAVRAVNSAATSGSSDKAVGRTAAAPTVTTTTATGIGPFAATLNGLVNPNGGATTAFFQYGLTTSYDGQATVSPGPGSGNSPVGVSAAVTGLSCNRLYHFRAVAVGAGATTYGSDVTLTTAECPPPTQLTLPYGVWEDLAWDQATDVDFLIDKMVAAGVQTVRMAFRWYMIEPTNNQFSYATHDLIVTKLAARGIEILGLLQHPPDWALNQAGNTPPVTDADWQDYVFHVAEHYRGRVASWEIWNEENLTQSFTGGSLEPNVDPVRYTQMLRVAFNAIRSADSSATVVLGGLAGNGVYEYWTAPQKQDYLQKIYDNGGKNYFDVLAIHPYVHPLTQGLVTLQTFVQGTRAVMAANGDGAKPLWFSEIGTSVDAATYTPAVSETQQANWVRSVYGARASMGADRIYLYELHELYPPPTDVGWGLIRHNLTLRPSYYAYQEVTLGLTPTIGGAVVATPAGLRFAATKQGASGALTSVTAGQTVTVTFIGTGSAWTATANQPWVQITNGTGTGAGQFTASIVNPGNVLGGSTSVSATITVSAPTASNVSTTVGVTLTIDQTGGSGSTPFGQVDTPLQNAAGVVGAVGVTGWALDNIGVSSVKIYRDCLNFEPQNCQFVGGNSVVFIGDAVFVAGARPDVEGAFAGYPQAYRAGWGYLLLTNMLPHVPNSLGFGGQGAITLYAVATDAEGNVTVLGRTAADHQPTAITLANDTIAKPFGAIDTPGQGQTVSGSLSNFGWVLTPDSNTNPDAGDILMPTNGSTINVYIDGVSRGTVTYNQCRGTVGNPVPSGVHCNDDVANIFGNVTPQPVFTMRTSNATKYRNLDAGRAAIGSFDIDTRTLSNGIHSIAWGVSDSAGRQEGIGSRNFVVLNTSGNVAGNVEGQTSTRPDPGQEGFKAVVEAPAVSRGASAWLGGLPIASTPVWGRTGFDMATARVPVPADADGARHVGIPELGRLEVWLAGVDPRPTEAAPIAGFLVANGTLRDLPPGSHLDPRTGAFTWAPGPGFFGNYRLVFVLAGGQIPVDVTIRPAGTVDPTQGDVRMFIDLPDPTREVRGPFTISGWALDPQAAIGSGIDAVHVWARPAEFAWPAFFLGAAVLDGVRPDVAAAFGAQFDRAGYRLTTSLPSGEFELIVYVHSARTGRWEDARVVRLIAR